MKGPAFITALMLPFMLTGMARAQQTCTPDQLQAASQHLLAHQKHLLAVHVQPMDETVSPDTAALIAAFKNALSAAVQNWMACRVPSTESAPSLQRHLARWLDANLPPTSSPPQNPANPQTTSGIYGANLRISVHQLRDRPRFLAIQAVFSIPCGTDSVLMLYERKNHRWQRVLLWQSGSYQQISGAFGDFFDYVLIPPSITGDWDVAVAHGTPWCTSRFSGFRVDLLHISEDGRPPRLLFHESAAYSRNGKQPSMRVTPHGFQLQIATTSLDPHQHTKTSIYRYRIQNHKVQRVQPVAATPTGFVDAWIQAPWAAASQWTAPAQLTPLRHLHATFASPSHPNSILYTQYLYKDVRRCTNPNQLQVHLQEIFTRRRKITSSNELYFLLEKHDGHFHMLSASSHPNPACTTPIPPAN